MEPTALTDEVLRAIWAACVAHDVQRLRRRARVERFLGRAAIAGLPLAAVVLAVLLVR